MFLHIIAFLFSFFVTVAIMPMLVKKLRQFKIGQVIQQDGPQSHQSKTGTPSMGGLGILFGLLLSAIAVLILRDKLLGEIGPKAIPSFIAVLVLTAVYALIGLVDDWMTIRPSNGKRGLSSKTKFGLQFIAAVGFVIWLMSSGIVDTTTSFGYWFSVELDWIYAVFAVLFITGMANFINITDGLDGLAAGLTAILALVLVLAYLMAVDFRESHLLVMLLSALAGSSVAFLWFNYNPAKVFMGDTGSLAIGAFIPAAVLVLKLEIVMIIAGAVFILDGLSSAVQWAVFKYTRITTGTGKRVFKMSPIHHHFELSGVPEQLVVVRFWIVGLLFGAGAILLLALSLIK
ncbi:MAG TPA: phospho-N-acetylmuramoyl-pentapeptide-transferase [Armatimonadota bacterium]|nr:phospho-N-acetylmuramoyl-pentapeptide-transferase [Armatimonadota bacterium]